MMWFTDQFSSAAAGRAATTGVRWSRYQAQGFDGLRSLLVPTYGQVLPRVDGWGRDLQFGRMLNLNDPLPIAIRSSGGNRSFEAGDYPYGAFIGTRYDADIVWAGGLFIRWPAGSGNALPASP